jgi:hypothetical protein
MYAMAHQQGDVEAPTIAYLLAEAREHSDHADFQATWAIDQ